MTIQTLSQTCAGSLMIEHFIQLVWMVLQLSGSRVIQKQRINNGLEKNGARVIVDILVLFTKKQESLC